MFNDFEFNPDHVPPIKLGFHVAQIVLSFVIFCLEIAVFRADGAAVNGNNGWTLGVCFLSVPAWIYLVMAPRYKRTRRIADPRGMLTFDALFTVIWLSAFSTQAAYNTAGSCGTACSVSKAIVGLGFFVCLFFGVTTFISIYTLKYWEHTNKLPGYDQVHQGRPHDIDPDKAAFSMAPHDEEAYAPVMNQEEDDHHRPENPYGVLNPYDGETAYASQTAASGAGGTGGYGVPEENPFRRPTPNQFELDTAYHPPPVVNNGGIQVPAAHDAAYDPDQPVHFPSANYERIER